MPAQLYSMLYHSQLAPHAAPACVPEIIKVARAFNAIHGVTGVLVFDGHRFLQHLEGPQEVLQDLIVRIARDTRHTHFSLQHAGVKAGRRQFANWSMAYAPIDDEALLAELADLKGLPALERFTELIPTFDMA